MRSCGLHVRYILIGYAQHLVGPVILGRRMNERFREGEGNGALHSYERQRGWERIDSGAGTLVGQSLCMDKIQAQYGILL